ncbi:MAG: hypothetical protein WC341_13820 [Bacteroidales bacterium]
MESKIDPKLRGKLAEKCEKLNLIGVYQMPNGSWVLTDGRSASDNAFALPSKGAVLSKVAQLLENMQPATMLNEEVSEVEMTFIVTTQVSLCDPTVFAKFPEDIRSSVCDALQHAVKFGEQNGFSHNMAEDISIGIVGVDTLCVN